jgi:hypothetical protein
VAEKAADASFVPAFDGLKPAWSSIEPAVGDGIALSSSYLEEDGMPHKDQAEISKGAKYEKKALADNHFVVCLCFVDGWK